MKSGPKVLARMDVQGIIKTKINHIYRMNAVKKISNSSKD